MRWLLVGTKDIFFGTQQMGAKNAKHVESESVREQKMKRWW